MEQQSDDWQRQLSRRVGNAVKQARLAAGLKAAELSRRCDHLGLPIHRTTLSKIEAGRSSFDLAELMVLARALQVPPLELIYPDLPDGDVDVWQGASVRSIDAAQWFSGEVSLQEDDGGLYSVSPSGSRLEAAREIERSQTEWLLAVRDFTVATERTPALEKLVRYKTDDLVRAVGRALQDGANVELSAFPEDVQSEIQAWVKEGPDDRARRVAREIRGINDGR